MQKQLYRFVVLTLLLSAVSACSTAPGTQPPSPGTVAQFPSPAPSLAPNVDNPSPAHLNAAKAFLSNIGAGEMIMLGYQIGLEQLAEEQPGLAELTERALSDVTPQDFLNVAAPAYSRYLSEEQLKELTRLSDNPSISELFSAVALEELHGREFSAEELTKDLSADQLTEILRFSVSDSALAMKEVLPQINRDLEMQVEAFVEGKLTRYIKVQ